VVSRCRPRGHKQYLTAFKTIPFDNGTKFHDYKALEAGSTLRCYFATPYHAWERGSNENLNDSFASTFRSEPASNISRKLIATQSPTLSTPDRASDINQKHHQRSTIGSETCCACSLNLRVLLAALAPDVLNDTKQYAEQCERGTGD
jgi:hypothetical protein